MAEPKRNFTRSYSDAERSFTISTVEGEELLTVKLAELNGGEAVTGNVASAAMRFVADAIVAVGNAAIKAGKDALSAMEEVVSKLREGTYTFRTAAGDGGLSIEEEMRVIAETLVEIKYMPDAETAKAKVKELYDQITEGKGKDGKPTKVRKAYNKLKTVPQIRAALAKAEKDEGSDILAGLGFEKPAAE